MKRWSHSSYELNWYPSDRVGEMRGIVWAKSPIGCAASVLVFDGIYVINTSSWRGLPADALLSLELHMKSICPRKD